MSTTANDKLMALLFVADSPSSPEALAQASGLTEGQVEAALEIIEAKLEQEGPLMLVKLAGGYQLATKPEYAEMISAFLQPAKQRLSRSLMEVLAIVAYKQPITASEIEVIRGLQSDYSVRALQERRLIAEVGRKAMPGRPILYGTTQQFLHQFNLKDLKDLPELQANLPFPAVESKIV